MRRARTTAARRPPVRRVLAAAVVTAVLGTTTLVSPPSASGTGAPSFVDVGPSHPFATEIGWLVGEGITTGWPDGTFRPGLAVSRQALAAFVYRFTGASAPACTQAAFSDVGTSHPFCREIAWLVAEGITTGYEDGTFRPGAAVSRQAMAAFLHRLGDPDGTAPTCTAAAFVDVGAGHPFCREVRWLVTEGIATGYEDGTFRGGAPVSRQAMAAFLYRLASEAPDPTDVDGCPEGTPRWSDPGAWPGPGGVPGPGDDVTVAHGQTVALDVDTASLGGLTIDGTLVVCRLDVSLTAAWVMVHGALRAGTEAQPFEQDLVITLTDADQDHSVMEMGTRGLMVMGGELSLHGATPQVAWTQLADHATAGTSTLTLDEPVDWSPGDRIAITTTDWYAASATEHRVVQSVGGGGTSVTLTSPLDHDHWGVLQHVTATGMGLAPDPSVVPSEQPTPLVLDERAEVANLTRPITIQGADDQAWQQDGFGAHVMVMGLDSDVAVEGVEMVRVGQRGELGRYPMHWHMLSYAEDGTELGDAVGHHMTGSTVTGSTNRCLTIHGTNGVTLQDNVCVGVRGHGVFLEDAAERRNTIIGNLVAQVRNPAYAHALKQHEVEYDGGSSGFWLSNPDNVVEGNVAADAQGFGFWLAYPQSPVGLSAEVPIRPDRLRFGTFEANTTHSNGHQGLMLDNAEIDDDGNTFPNQYWSTTDGQEASWPLDTVRRFTLHQITTYKNALGGFWNRATWPTYTEWVSADNEARFFAGAGAEGIIERSLVVGASLNSATPQPNPSLHPTAFASYHSSFDMRDNVVVSFPMVPGHRSGAFATDDYYIRPVDEGHIRNGGNLLIESDPGFRSVAPNASHVFSGALWDPHGTWGPAGRYLTYDEPFLTHGATCSDVDPPGTNAVSCEGPYYGVLEFVLDQANERWDARMPIDVTRFDAAGAEVGTWSVADGNLVSAFQNMRHFAAHPEGRYLLDFPGSPVPGDVAMTLENLHEAEDSFVLGVRFDGDDPAQVFSTTYYHYLNPGFADSPPSGNKHDFVAVASLAEVMASGDEVFWQDTANDVVWIRVNGGLDQPGTFGPFDDATLYEPMFLRVL